MYSIHTNDVLFLTNITFYISTYYIITDISTNITIDI